MAGLGFLVARGPLGVAAGRVAPFAWLAATVPGFDMVRVPARFGTLFAFGVSGLAGFGVAAVIDRLRTRTGALVAIVTVAGTLAVVLPAARNPPLRVRRLPSGRVVPSVYNWLAQHGDGGPLLELPIGTGVAAVVGGAYGAPAMLSGARPEWEREFLAPP